MLDIYLYAWIFKFSIIYFEKQYILMMLLSIKSILIKIETLLKLESTRKLSTNLNRPKCYQYLSAITIDVILCNYFKLQTLSTMKLRN